jgi:putative addiction module killer protein
MEAQEKEIKYYETVGGKQPFRDWLLALKDKRAQAKVDARLERVRHGNLGYCEPVGEGVMELKIDFGPGYRVYFGQDGKKLVVLLNGGDKSSQRKDIKTAREYWADYRRRYGKK